MTWLWAGAGLTQSSLPSLTDQHVDLLITYQAEATPPLAMLARNGDVNPNVSFASNEVVLVATEASQFTMPMDVPALGLTNSQTFWWLRQSSPPAGTLFLGLAVGGIAPGTFDGNFLRVYLTGFDGPGDFFLWQDLPLGGVQVFLDSRDGLDTSDMVPVLTAGHDHYNWAFTRKGVYSLTFRVEGTLAGGGGTISSLETTFVFHVRPLGVVTPYARWQKAHWLQGTPESISGLGVDSDNDGVPNALEYALNLDPCAPSLSGRPEFSFVSFHGQTYGALTFTRLKGAPDLTYVPVASGTLDFSAALPLTEVYNLIDYGETETVTVRDPLLVSDAAARFLQLRVVLEP